MADPQAWERRVPDEPTIATWQSLSGMAGKALEAGQVAALGRYLDLLLEANRRVNLTRIRDRRSAEIEHVADALTLLRFLPAEPCEIADIGSGGGVPGIVLAIARPDCRVTLIESIGKKASFLELACRELGLSRVGVLAERAETVGRGERRERFDVVTARAVAEMATLLEWSMPLLRVGGCLLAMKGPRVTTELAGCERWLRPLGAARPVVRELDIPGLPGRRVVEVVKTAPTDSRFPPSPTRSRRR